MLSDAPDHIWLVLGCGVFGIVGTWLITRRTKK